MNIRVDLEFSQEDLELLWNHAARAGYKRDNPHIRWIGLEKVKAARWLIASWSQVNLQSKLVMLRTRLGNRVDLCYPSGCVVPDGTRCARARIPNEVPMTDHPPIAPVPPIARSSKDILDDKIYRLQQARLAMSALEWCDEVQSEKMQDRPATVTFSFGVNWGSSTNEGKAAVSYAKASFQILYPQIVEMMRTMAQRDIDATEDIT